MSIGNKKSDNVIPGKRGIVYLSRIPPFMKIEKIKHLLSSHGIITRIYGSLEDKSRQKKRQKYKNNHKKFYTQVWVEFARKKDAKQCAEDLNNQRIGGKKRSRYYDDIWNIKYLSKFKWHHLTEKLKEEKQVRQARIREEMSQQNK